MKNGGEVGFCAGNEKTETTTRENGKQFEENEAKMRFERRFQPRLSEYRLGKDGTTTFFLFIARTGKIGKLDASCVF